jgi:hypothetical protein
MTGRPGRGGPGQPPSQDQSATEEPPEDSAAPATGELPPGDRAAPATGELPAGGALAGGGDAGTGHGATTLTAVRAGPGHVVTALAGLREPIVVILLLIAFFTWISGKPLDGLLMLVVGVSLAWDTGRRARQGGPPEAAAAQTGGRDLGTAGPDDAGDAGPASRPDAPPAAARRRRRLLVLAWLAGGALYVLLVGSFSRYSWPATVPVVALGAVVVAAGWRGPRHSRPAPASLPATGLALWGLVLVAGCLWELSSLFQQPTLAISSYAHPTISTLTDPVLGTWAGRSIFLAAWLGLGWFLVER